MRAAKAQACRRGVQGDIVKNGVNSVLFEFVQDDLSINLRRQKNVVKVPVVLAIRRHDRAAEQAVLLERCESFVVALPDREPLLGDSLGFLELRPEKSGGNLARQK